jgi:hypothetical protein
MLPFHVVQNWSTAAKLLAAVAIFGVGFGAFLVISPGDGDGPQIVAGADDEASGDFQAPDDGGEYTPSSLPVSSVPTTDEQASTSEAPTSTSPVEDPPADGATTADSAAPDDAAADGAPANPGTADSGAFESLRNSQPKFSQYAGVPSAQLELATLTEPVDPPDNGSVGDGQFRLACEYSHFSNDDPIVFPGEPGKSHLHMFFGNTDVNAFSTDESLLDSGGGTCNGFELNRSGYWTPALLDGKGNAVVPDSIILYYKTKAPGSVQALPQGLKMIAGNTDAETFTAGHDLAWSCGSSGNAYGHTNRIPDCGGDVINATIVFPNCWDGQNLDAPDHKSHMLNINESKPCPASHPVRLPQISILLYFPGTGSVDGWHLSSDLTSGFNSGPGATLHADWWGGWNDDAINLWTSGCMQAARNCSFGQTGTPRRLMSLNPLQSYEGENVLALPNG